MPFTVPVADFTATDLDEVARGLAARLAAEVGPGFAVRAEHPDWGGPGFRRVRVLRGPFSGLRCDLTCPLENPSEVVVDIRRWSRLHGLIDSPVFFIPVFFVVPAVLLLLAGITGLVPAELALDRSRLYCILLPVFAVYLVGVMALASSVAHAVMWLTGGRLPDSVLDRVAELSRDLIHAATLKGPSAQLAPQPSVPLTQVICECGHLLPVSEDRIGLLLRCPACRTDILVSRERLVERP